MNKEKFIGISKIAVRMLLGTMFVFAAVMKLLSIDYFEIYIYSFNIFSFAFTTVVSRLVIACEIILGFCLIFKAFYKQVWTLSMLMMVGFTLFLAYVIIFRNDENCHCFGELIQLNPSESIFKNIASIFLLLFVRNEQDYKYKSALRKWLVAIVVGISIILPFVVFPMDTLYNKIFSKDNNINTIAFDKSLNDSVNITRLDVIFDDNAMVIHRDSLAKFDIQDEKYIINYISATCNFCRMGTEKLMMMLDRNEIDRNRVKFMIWGYDEDILAFMQETKTMDCEYWFIHPLTSLDITFGKFPVYVWTSDGNIINTGDLRDLNESRIIEFLK